MAEKKDRAADPMYGFWRGMHQADDYGVGGKEVCIIDVPELKALKIATIADSPAHSWEQPQCGLWKVRVGGHYVDGKKQPYIYQPLQIWLCEPSDPLRVAVKPANYRPGLKLVGKLDIDQDVDADRIATLWPRATFIKTAERDAYKNAGKRWPSDPPPPVGGKEPARSDVATTSAAAPNGNEVVAETGGTAETAAAPGPGPGDNSKDLDAFRQMRAELLNEISEATAYFGRNPIENLDQANKCENWKERIRKLTAKADDMRETEKAPHLAKCNEIQGRWKPLVDDGKACVKTLEGIGDTWARAETARRQKQAQDEAAAKLKADNEQKERDWQAALDRNAEIEAEREDMEVNDPIAAMTGSLPEFVEVPAAPAPLPTTAPVVAVERIQLGTGRKRSAGKAAPVTGIIIDLAKAAAHLASLNDRDLIALIQKRADASAKVGVAYPGCRLSSDPTPIAEAAE